MAGNLARQEPIPVIVAKQARGSTAKQPTPSGSAGALQRCAQLAQHRRRDRGGAVASAELAWFEAGQKGAIDRLLDGTCRCGCSLMVMAIGEPVQHQRGR